MIKKILFILFLGILLTQTTYSQTNQEYLKFIDFFETQNTSNYKISYSLKKDPSYEGDEKFIVEIIEEGKTRKKICETDLQNLIINNKFENPSIFQKITCEFKKNRGKTTIIGKVTDRDYHQINSITNILYIYDAYKLSMNFEDLENEKTKIEINIDSNYKDITIKQSIPKSVIPNLNKENKNQLITSDKEYEILESDPLIAWNIEKTPAKINYTINKKISLKDKEEFTLKLEKSSIYKKLEYVLLILIILILILIFKPTIVRILKKKKNEK